MNLTKNQKAKQLYKDINQRKNWISLLTALDNKIICEQKVIESHAKYITECNQKLRELGFPNDGDIMTAEMVAGFKRTDE